MSKTKTIITLWRKPFLVGCLANLDVWVDDQKMASIANGAELKLAVGAMRHSVQIKQRLWPTEGISNVVDTSNSVELVCGYTPLFLWVCRLSLVLGLATMAIGLGQNYGLDFGETIDYFFIVAGGLILLGAGIVIQVGARPGGLIYLRHKELTAA